MSMPHSSVVNLSPVDRRPYPRSSTGQLAVTVLLECTMLAELKLKGLDTWVMLSGQERSRDDVFDPNG